MMVTTVLASPVPLIVGFEVIPSLAELPVSDTSAMLTTGFFLSRPPPGFPFPVLPAAVDVVVILAI